MSQAQRPADDHRVIINAAFLRDQVKEGVRTFFAPVLGAAAAAAVAAVSDPKRAGKALRLAPDQTGPRKAG